MNFEDAALPLRGNIYGAAMRLTRDPDEAADLVQDVFVRAFRFWGSFKEGSNIKAWMFTILRNTFINGYRRRGRQHRLTCAVSAEMGSLGSVASVAYSDSEPLAPAEAVLDSHATSTMVLEAIERLPYDFREAVEMADLDGMTYKEIAAIMDCPTGTVMSRIYRGRKQLREDLFEHAAELGLVDARGGDGS